MGIRKFASKILRDQMWGCLGGLGAIGGPVCSLRRRSLLILIGCTGAFRMSRGCEIQALKAWMSSAPPAHADLSTLFHSFCLGRSRTYEDTNTSMPTNTQVTLVCICLLLRLHTAFSSPSIALNTPSVSIIQNPAALNLSKPTYPPLVT